MENLKDNRGYNQIWVDAKSTRVRASRRCDYMISNMNPSPQKNVLEIGCGTGANSHMLANRTGMQVLGTDLCEPFIDKAKETYSLPNLQYEVLDFNQPTLFDGQLFDYIVGNGILHHLYPKLNKALVAMKILLKPSGRIIFMEPNLLNPYVYLIFCFPFFRKAASLEPAEMAFSKNFAIQKLRKTGYESIKVVYKDFLLPGVPDFMVVPLISVGNFLEKTPMRILSQSLGIVASKPNDI
jgi:2-polyprenyl-3-methyl-5-hydroxy-6-metoxy-1,4-benzoquinol methylase